MFLSPQPRKFGGEIEKVLPRPNPLAANFVEISPVSAPTAHFEKQIEKVLPRATPLCLVGRKFRRNFSFLPPPHISKKLSRKSCLPQAEMTEEYWEARTAAMCSSPTGTPPRADFVPIQPGMEPPSLPMCFAGEKVKVSFFRVESLSIEKGHVASKYAYSSIHIWQLCLRYHLSIVVLVHILSHV